MQRQILSAITLFFLCGPAQGQMYEFTTLHNTYTDGTVEEGWGVTIPPNGCDFFNVRFDRLLFDGMNGYGTNGEHSKICGVTVSQLLTDATHAWPLVGLFEPNLTLDPTGNTPDLSSPLYPGSFTSDTGHALDSDSDSFDCVTFDLPLHEADNLLSAHAAVNFYVGENLYVGADTQSGSGHSFYDDSCYQTPANPSPIEWSININTFPKQGTKAQLVANHSSLDRCGDFLRIQVDLGEKFGVFFAVDPGPGSGPVLLLFIVNGQYVLIPVPTKTSPVGGFYLNLGAGPLPAGNYVIQAQWFAVGNQTKGLSNEVAVIVN